MTSIKRLPSTGLTAVSWIVISIGEKETFGSTGLSASIIRLSIVIPAGKFQYASVNELGSSGASRIPWLTLGGLLEKLF